jgi:predicted deacylase
MTLEAEGRYDQAKDLLARMGIVRPEVQKVLDKLTNVPVDIEPAFTTADGLAIRK